MKILVRSPNWIGDQILAFPFFYELRRRFPRATIVALCVPWVRDLQYKGLVDRVIVLPRPKTPSPWSKLQNLEEVAGKLRDEGAWDWGISLPNSFSSAYLIWRAGVRKRRGYQDDGRSLLLNDRVPWDGDPSLHRSQAYLHLVPPTSEEGARTIPAAVDFWGVPAENDLDPRIPGVLERFESSRFWPGFTPLSPPAEPFWVLAPGATADSRRWPVDRFIRLARKVRAEKGWKGIVVGGPSEAALGAELAADPETGLEDWTARCPVPSLYGLFSKAQFTLTNESGLAHVASLCGSFVQIVCGAADPRRTRPVGPGRVQVSIHPVACWPCERNTCERKGSGYLECLTGQTPEALWEEIERGLRLKSR
jgi:heptosyltransferase-2